MTMDAQALRTLAADYAQAWSSASPEAVASFFAQDGRITINRGEPWTGRDAVVRMAAGFYADFPDLVVRCDDCRMAGSHAIFVWTLEGHHAGTGNFVQVGGWEEWELRDDMIIASSRGWYDAADYARQVGG